MFLPQEIIRTMCPICYSANHQIRSWRLTGTTLSRLFIEAYLSAHQPLRVISRHEVPT